MGVAPQHAQILVPCDCRDFHDVEAALEKTGGGFMTQVVEVQIVNARSAHSADESAFDRLGRQTRERLGREGRGGGRAALLWRSSTTVLSELHRSWCLAGGQSDGLDPHAPSECEQVHLGASRSRSRAVRPAGEMGCARLCRRSVIGSLRFRRYSLSELQATVARLGLGWQFDVRHRVAHVYTPFLSSHFEQM